MVSQIDETKLEWIERLGLAYCRLNSFEWDEIVGSKPEGFDSMPDFFAPWTPWEKAKPCKHDFVNPAANAIVSIIGEANASRCWWKFVLGKSEEEWARWYISQLNQRSSLIINTKQSAKERRH